MLEEPIINPSASAEATVDKPTESPASADGTPAPVTPTETPITTPPVVAPEPISAEATMGKPVTPVPAVPDVRSLLAKAMAKIQFRKQAKLEKIMILARSRGQVTNDDAQKLLRVSDATATRYLAALVKAGRLQRAGVRGGAVYRFVQ